MSAQILNTEGAANYIGLAVSTLEKKRLRGDGPPFCRMGLRAVRYRVSDLDAWVESRIVRSTSEGRSS